MSRFNKSRLVDEKSGYDHDLFKATEDQFENNDTRTENLPC